MASTPLLIFIELVRWNPLLPLPISMGVTPFKVPMYAPMCSTEMVPYKSDNCVKTFGEIPTWRAHSERTIIIKKLTCRPHAGQDTLHLSKYICVYDTWNIYHIKVPRNSILETVWKCRMHRNAGHTCTAKYVHLQPTKQTSVGLVLAERCSTRGQCGCLCRLGVIVKCLLNGSGLPTHT